MFQAVENTPVQDVFVGKIISEGINLLKIVDYTIHTSETKGTKQVYLHVEGKPDARIKEPATHKGEGFPETPAEGQAGKVALGVYSDFSKPEECVKLATNLKIIAKALGVSDQTDKVTDNTVEGYLKAVITILKDAGFNYYKITCKEKAGEKYPKKYYSFGTFTKTQADNTKAFYVLAIPEKDMASISTVGGKTTLAYNDGTIPKKVVFDMANKYDYTPVVVADADPLSDTSTDPLGDLIGGGDSGELEF